MIDCQIHTLLQRYAAQYETADFIKGDPSWFMHQVEGCNNQETMAFLAQALSYGNRQQFIPKIQLLLDWSENNPYDWIKSGAFRQNLNPDDNTAFYRLYTNRHLYLFLTIYQKILLEHESLYRLIKGHANTGLEAIDILCRAFEHEDHIIPKNSTSACKRLAMFLRWMVRDNSPVDIGIWNDVFDRRELIMPLDTHVVQQAVRLGLLRSHTATMRTAIQLTNQMTQIFPHDPLLGDFALFGYGVNNKNNK